MTVLLSVRPARGLASACEDAYRSSGPSPTLHLVGVGKVGQAFLRQWPGCGPTLCGATDSSGTVWRRRGLEAAAVADWKAAGRRLADQEGARNLEAQLLAEVCGVDVVVDCVSSSGRGEDALARAQAVLRTGAALVLASKDALAHAPAWFFREVSPERLGLNAVLGGTGAALQRERAWLAEECRSVALVCNATSTVVLEAIEQGAGVAGAVAEARHRGLLEGDPREDLDGGDAARKLVLVSAAVLGREVGVEEVECDRFADLDPDELRARRRRGITTRLVARAGREGPLTVRYEAVPRSSSLAVPGTQAAYCYSLSHGRRRLHVGAGLGPARTAAALWQDLRRILPQGGAR